MVRTPGGAFDDVKRKTVYDPFREATGIEIVPVAATVAKMLAMFKAGEAEIDAIDTGNDALLELENNGALVPLDYKSFKYTNPDDIDSAVRLTYQVGAFTYAFVLGFNTTVYAVGKEPKNWAEFWDIKAFPGPRTLAGMESGAPNLEIALIADGVPMDKLYPLDIARAFKKLREIRPNITKWWDSGAVSAQMLAGKQVVLGSLWSGRILPLIDDNAPVAIEWNQSSRQLQTLCILKGAPNLDNAREYIDFAMQPKQQAEVARLSGYGPVNMKAFDYIDAKMAARLPTSPEHLKISFATNARWWVEHRDEVSSKWQAFLLGE